MLTSEHAIIEYKAGRAIPDRLTQNAHRHYVDYAERMLAIYQEGIGRQRRWLHRDIEAVFADEPDCPVRRIQAFCLAGCRLATLSSRCLVAPHIAVLELDARPHRITKYW